MTLTLQVSGYTWNNGIYTVRIKVSDKLDNTSEETYTFKLQQIIQEVGDLVVSQKVFSPEKRDLGLKGNLSKKNRLSRV